MRKIIGIRISGLLKIVHRVADLFTSDENVPLRVEGFSVKAITSRWIFTAGDFGRRIFIADDNEYKDFHCRRLQVEGCLLQTITSRRIFTTDDYK
jgi:hypothetical protein